MKPTPSEAPMPTAEDSHRYAMDLAAQGFMAQMSATPNEAILLFEQALALELAAIRQLPEPLEPTWSILHRSAGWMAYHCRRYDTAAELAGTALAGNPPADVAAELQHLLDVARAGHDGLPSV